MNVFYILVLLTATSQAKILDESLQNQNGLVAQSTTVPDLKEKPEQVEPEPPCFHSDIDLCFNKTSSETKPSCDCEQHPLVESALVCCNVTDINRAISCVGNTSAYLKIHIINANLKDLNIGQMNSYVKQVHSLVITDGNIKTVSGQFSRFSSIKCLNFSNNNITEFNNERTFLHLHQLQILDLSANSLIKLPSPPTTAKVDIRGNLKVSCRNVSSAIERGVDFLYKEISLCEVETVYFWFNSTASVSIQHLEKVKQLDDDCPKGCKCVPDRMFYTSENRLEFIAKVDCSNLDLTELPLKLPEHTLSLNISNNSISSLVPLTRNDFYKGIRDLFADDNLIKDLEELEGTEFLENFTQLSLKNNKINFIPTYLLSNSNGHLNGKLVYLGGNRIQCDCQTYKNQRVR